LSGAKNKDPVCPPFGKLVPLLDGGRSGRGIEAVREHAGICPRCGFVMRLLKQLLREELTSEEKALLDSVGRRKQAQKFRRFAKKT
jgi:hypothetical protein